MPGTIRVADSNNTFTAPFYEYEPDGTPDWAVALIALLACIAFALIGSLILYCYLRRRDRRR